jgi:peptidoglycan/LPS O-acetylase OafA/YrhL
MDNNGWPKRLYALDVSRAFASLAVVLWHWRHFAVKGYSLPGDFSENKLPLYNILRLFYENGGTGVDYFFLLSGFIFFWLYKAPIQNRAINAREFGVQRFSRLYPLHFVTLLVVAALQLLYASREGTSFVFPYNDTYHFFLNLCFATKWGLARGNSFNAPVWSVSVEVLLYSVFFVVAFFRKGGRVFCLTISLAAFILSYILHKAILDGLALFFLGGLVFQIAFLISTKKRILKAPVYFVTMLAWSSVIINYYFLDLSNIALKFGIAGRIALPVFSTYVLFPFTVCSLALAEIDKGPFLRRFRWMGDISYSTYLIHFPLQVLFALAVSLGILSREFYLSPSYLAIYFMLLIPISYIVFVRFERPVQERIRDQL